MNSHRDATRIARAMIALGITLAAVTQLWATDCPPDVKKGTWKNTGCELAKTGYGGPGICTAINACAGNTSGHCLAYEYMKRQDYRLYGTCKVPLVMDMDCDYYDWFTCALIWYYETSLCAEPGTCELWIQVGDTGICHAWTYGGGQLP